MTPSFNAKPFFATFALLGASIFANGQQLQRSMVYHVPPPQPASQAATVKPAPVVDTTAPVVRQAPRYASSAETQPASDLRLTPTAIVVNTSSVSHAAPPAAAPSIAPATVKMEERTAPRTEVLALRKTGDKPSQSFGKKFDRWFFISSAVFAAGAIMDHTSTTAGMRRAGAYEANPLLRNSDGSFSPGKHIALTAGIYGASLLLQNKHPRMANALRFISGFAKIGVSIHNRRTASGLPDAPPR